MIEITRTFTSTDEVPGNLPFVVFPNPARSELNLVIRPEPVNPEVEVFNSMGRLMFRTTNLKPVIAGFPAGVYLVRVKVENSWYSARFIKE